MRLKSRLPLNVPQVVSKYIVDPDLSLSLARLRMYVRVHVHNVPSTTGFMLLKKDAHGDRFSFN